MKFLLLILTLMTGSVADDVGDDDDDEGDDDIKACSQGWIQFTCNYTQTKKIYDFIDVLTPNGTTLRSSQTDVWEDRGRFSLFNHTKQKKLEVVVKPLERDDFGKYQCRYYRSNSPPYIKKWNLQPGHCKKTSPQTVHRADKTTITCDYPDDDEFRFLCKDERFTCEDVLSTKSGLNSSGTFTLKNERRFIVSISDVSSQHAGVYWCGLESRDGSYRVSVRQIQLEVKDPPPAPAPSTASSTSPSASQTPTAHSSTAQTPAAAPAGPQLHTVITVMVCAALLLLLLLLLVSVSVYKRFGQSKYRTTGEAQNHEDFVYEEIPNKVQKSDTRALMETIYTTANFPTNPSALTHEPKVSSEEVTSNAYLTLWDSARCPKASHPSRDSQNCSTGHDGLSKPNMAS